MFSVTSTASSEFSSWRHGWPCCRPIISRQCFFGFLIVCALLVFTPLLFTDKLRRLARLADNNSSESGREFRFALLSDNQIHADLPSPHLSTAPRSPLKKDDQYPIQPSVCAFPEHMPYLVLFVPSRPQNAEERAAVRETWGFHARLCNVQLVFGMGRISSAEVQSELVVENSVYGDLLQTHQIFDAYHNQTRLILEFLRWGMKNCPAVKFIGKADEDSWINIFGVLKYLSDPSAAHSVTGHFLWNEVPKRREEEKWFLTIAEYANHTYPPFALGQLYIYPTDYLSKVLWASEKITVHWLDDVYIAGQIPHYLKMNILHIPERADLELELQGIRCPARSWVIIHAVDGERKREVFYEKCMVDFRRSPVCRSSNSANQSLADLFGLPRNAEGENKTVF